MTPTLSPLISELINKKKCYTVETQTDDDCLRSKDQLLARISELTDRQSSLISYIQELTRLLEIAEDTPNKSTAKSVTSEPRDIATSQPINESLPALREIPKLSNRVTNSMMSSTPASAPMRMDNGTTLPSPPVSMQQYDTYSNALKTTCNSSHAAATEPKHSGTHPVTMHTLSQSPATPRPVSSCFSMTPTLSPLISELINKKKCYTVETPTDDDCLRSKDQLLARISELTDRQSSLISYIQKLTRLLEIAEDTPNKSTAKSVTSEPRDIATSQPINESLPVLREIPKLSNRVTNSMMSSTPASAPMRMDNGTTLPSPPVSMQQYDTYSNALKTICNSSHAAATEPSAISTASDVSEKNFENQRIHILNA
ncbi:uncharacterized protein LOC124368249 [Homalodisca vitripennis]|uniref:uncharacterized protein LOC124368249 n=1 Tax=Homalodisca vitripennis TaxID=197043 RepID=UPI001EEBB247|nr:uncharacterized protein LOC124368249 [Homalodisca vitripennis]